MNRLKQAMHRATKYRGVRYMLYGLIYFVWIPLRYVLALLLGWIAAVIEETRETTEALADECRTLRKIVKREREIAKTAAKQDEAPRFEDYYCQCDEVATVEELEWNKCSACGKQLV